MYKEIVINLYNDKAISGMVGDSREVVYVSQYVVVDKYSAYSDYLNIAVENKTNIKDYDPTNPDGTPYKKGN